MLVREVPVGESFELVNTWFGPPNPKFMKITAPGKPHYNAHYNAMYLGSPRLGEVTYVEVAAECRLLSKAEIAKLCQPQRPVFERVLRADSWIVRVLTRLPLTFYCIEHCRVQNDTTTWVTVRVYLQSLRSTGF
jgi:hypothetical protein